MMKTQIGLGVLSFPQVFDALGMIPGVILLLVIATITTWSDYMIGVFKLKHREVYGVDDVGYLIFGRAGREFFSFAFVSMLILTSGAAIQGISIALNALTDHSTCTRTFVAVAFVAVFMLSSLRTLGHVTWLAVIGVAGIITGSKSNIQYHVLKQVANGMT